MSMIPAWGEGGNGIGCTGECCAFYELHITSTNVSELDITLGGGTGDDGCFDKTCFATQTGYLDGIPMSSTAVSFDWTATPGVLKITFSPALTFTPGSNLFEFTICKNSTDTCRTYLDWETKDNHGNPDSYGHDTILTGCDPYIPPPCGGCDLAWQSCNSSLCDICVELGASAGAQCITVYFQNGVTCLPSSVSLPAGYYCPGLGGGGMRPGSISSYTTDAHGKYTSFTWCAPAGCTWPQCEPICFNYASGCQTIEYNRVYTTTDVENAPCDPQVAIFKAAHTSDIQHLVADSGQQNYPNPLDANSGFNTTIPFSTSVGGDAIITVVNEKGIKVLSDDENILGAGQHFFYFTAKDLPSGTYYYTIEFPAGVVIANKTMLVIR